MAPKSWFNCFNQDQTDNEAGPTSESRKEVLYEGTMYDVTDWIRQHPGGKVIEFYTENGEDATLVIQQFHHRSLSRVRGIMNSLPKRQADGHKPATARHNELTADFLKLHSELEREGFFKPSLTHLAARALNLILLTAVGDLCLMGPYNGHIVVRILGILLLALFAGHCGWLMHEGGHHSLTGRPAVDRILQSLSMGLGLGLSGSGFSHIHNRHHAMPQRLNHDMDTDTLPLLTTNVIIVPSSAQPDKKGKRKLGLPFWIRKQAWFFLPVHTLIIGIYWKLITFPHALSLVDSTRPTLLVGLIELLCLIAHYCTVYLIGLVNYFFILWLVAMYMVFNFALSHTHTPVTTVPTHWVEYALLHTVDIQPSWWCDWWMGYLNYQIEHHLFPTMPQFRQRLIIPRVRALAEKHGLPYQCISYREAAARTFRNLSNVARELTEVLESAGTPLPESSDTLIPKLASREFGPKV